MFFLVDTRERRPRREPDRLPRWVAVVTVLVVIGVVSGGLVGVIALFAAVVLLVDRALPAVREGGLHDHRQ